MRTSAAGIIEYVYPGRKPILANGNSPATTAIGPPPISLGESFFLTRAPSTAR